MKMHVLSGGRLRLRENLFWPAPTAARRSRCRFRLPAAPPQGNVLFDSGCHPSLAANAEARWGGLAKIMMPISPRRG